MRLSIPLAPLPTVRTQQMQMWLLHLQPVARHVTMPQSRAASLGHLQVDTAQYPRSVCALTTDRAAQICSSHTARICPALSSSPHASGQQCIQQRPAHASEHWRFEIACCALSHLGRSRAQLSFKRARWIR